MLIKYNKPNLRGLGDITLTPGLNDVPAEKWAVAVKTFGKNLQRLLDMGVIEIEEHDGQPLEAADLARLPERKAVKLVKDTVDERLLMRWHDGEERKLVVTAIEAQLEVLAKAGEPETKGPKAP